MSLFASKRNLSIGWMVSALFIAFWLSDFSRHPVLSTFAILLAGLIFTAVPICIVTRTPRLDIVQNGISLTIFSQTTFVKWDDIRSIRVGWVNAGYALWAMNKSLFVKYHRNGRELTLVVRPLFFGVTAATIVRHIREHCSDRHDLTRMMLQDLNQGALL